MKTVPKSIQSRQVALWTMAETCVVCNNPDAENMLLCDKCNKGYHTACIGLDHVPEEEFWFCGDCIEGTAVRSTSKIDLYSHKFCLNCDGSRACFIPYAGAKQNASLLVISQHVNRSPGLPSISTSQFAAWIQQATDDIASMSMSW